MQRLGSSSVFKACEFAGRSAEALSGRELSPKVTETGGGCFTSFEQSIGINRCLSLRRVQLCASLSVTSLGRLREC